MTQHKPHVDMDLNCSWWGWGRIKNRGVLATHQLDSTRCRWCSDEVFYRVKKHFSRVLNCLPACRLEHPDKLDDTEHVTEVHLRHSILIPQPMFSYILFLLRSPVQPPDTNNHTQTTIHNHVYYTLQSQYLIHILHGFGVVYFNTWGKKIMS